MLAAVTAKTLNVRSVPAINGRVLGTLPYGKIVEIADSSNSWLEIPFRKGVGYIASSYLDRPISPCRVVGTVNVEHLNVRNQPSALGSIIGTLRGGTVVNPLGLMPGWVEIEFNGALGYVAGSFVSLFTKTSPYLAEVTSAKLNVRVYPSLHSPAIGHLMLGQPVSVITDVGEWCEIAFGGSKAYVARSFLLQREESDHSPAVLAESADDGDIIPISPVAQSNPLCPLHLLPVSGDSTQQNVARTWNKFGAELKRLSEGLAIDVACAVAVLCVESSGKGFEQGNAGRMVIRFENHKFWQYWGRHHPDVYRNHFQYDSNTIWKGHKWRASSDAEWQGFHGNQRSEWQVFEFAEKINAEAAMLSISMGAPQIMGFHYQRLGYSSAAEMFQEFSNEIGPQIRGLFRFFNTTMIAHLRNLDFTAFAGLYNGSGQREIYGGRIAQHYRSFKDLSKGATLL